MRSVSYISSGGGARQIGPNLCNFCLGQTQFFNQVFGSLCRKIHAVGADILDIKGRCQ